MRCLSQALPRTKELMRRALYIILILALVVIAGGWFLSRPPALPDASIAEGGDVKAGQLVFAAAGCASCHIAPGAEKTDAPVLAGGKAFPSDFGTFYAPNISSDEETGIGAWSDAALYRAVTAGISPDGRYYYPAFPTHSYALASQEDIRNLVAFLRTLPADATPSKAHGVGFPFNIRRGLWLWRVAFAPKDWVRPAETSELERGRYLVETLGHCAECHTPRNALGGLQTAKWMAGAALPVGEGRVPNLTPAKLDWSVADIAEYLKSGFTPDYDVVGGEMADVVENTSKLPDEDRQAIAAYLKALPAIE